MKVNSRAVSFATLIQFSGAVPGKTSSLNLAPAQPSMAGRPMPLEAPLRKRGSGPRAIPGGICAFRSEEKTSELQSLMRNWYAAFCSKNKNRRILIEIYNIIQHHTHDHN